MVNVVYLIYFGVRNFTFVIWDGHKLGNQTKFLVQWLNLTLCSGKIGPTWNSYWKNMTFFFFLFLNNGGT